MNDELQPYAALRAGTSDTGWTDGQLAGGIADAAARVLARILIGETDTPNWIHHYEDEEVASYRLEEAWRSTRLAVVLLRRRTAASADKTRQLIADLQREFITAIVLPDASPELFRRCVPERGAIDTVIALFPLDIDALNRGTTSFQELFDYKLARRIYEGASHCEAQFAESLMADYRSRASGWESVLSAPGEVLERRREGVADLVPHPTLAQLRRRIGPGRGVVLIGPSGSGKSVLALQIMESVAARFDRAAVVELSSVAVPLVGFSQSFLFPPVGQPTNLLLLDDLQSQPTMARYVLAALNIGRRVHSQGSIDAICTSWPEFGSVAVQLYEGCYPQLVEPAQLARDLLAHDAPDLDAAARALLLQRFGDDLGILRIAAGLASRNEPHVDIRDVAEALWSSKQASVDLPESLSTALALVCGSLSRYDLPAPPALIERLTGANASVLRAAAPGLLRPVGDGYSLGHRALSGLLVEWLGARGGWSSGPIRVATGSDDVVLEYLRELAPSSAVEALRGLQTRLGFRPEERMARRATAVVQIWEAFSAVVQRIEHQQDIDPTWGNSPASAMFAAKALYYVGKSTYAASSVEFLRSHWSVDADGKLDIELVNLATTDDFKSIGDRMRDEDQIDPQRWSDLPAAEVDPERFHQTWVAGVLLTAESFAAESAHRSRLVRGVEALQEADGYFYPRRVAWCTARVLLGLASCGRTIETSEAARRAADWLLRPRTQGGACSNGVWLSGTGTWNSQLEATAMVVMALAAAGIDVNDERLTIAREYLLTMQPHWTAPGQELDGALAAQAFLEAGGDWGDVAESAYMLSRWAQGEAFWQTATLRAQDTFAQGCRVAQIASHLVDIGWRAIDSDLPAFLEALSPPDAFRLELLEEGGRRHSEMAGGSSARVEIELHSADTDVAQGTSSGDTLCDFLVGLDDLRLRDLVVIGKYRRFDPIGRSMLRNRAQEIRRQLSVAGDWHKNFLIWAPPGTGKSYFVSQIASEAVGVDFQVVNLAQLTKADWETRLREVAASSEPTLCLVDEIDARRDESWPYEILFPQLDLSKSKPTVFVLVGSGGEGKEALVRLIQERPKGSDLIDRVPARQRMEVPPPELGDRLLILVSALLEHRSGEPIDEIEKLALYYALSREDIRSSRQSEDFAIEVLSRVPGNQSQVFYDSLFSAGDRDNQQFYADHIEIARSLQHRFMHIIADASAPKEGAHP